MVASLSLHKMSQCNNWCMCPDCPRHNLVSLLLKYHTLQWDIDVVIITGVCALTVQGIICYLYFLTITHCNGILMWLSASTQSYCTYFIRFHFCIRMLLYWQLISCCSLLVYSQLFTQAAEQWQEVTHHRCQI